MVFVFVAGASADVRFIDSAVASWVIAAEERGRRLKNPVPSRPQENRTAGYTDRV